MCDEGQREMWPLGNVGNVANEETQVRWYHGLHTPEGGHIIIIIIIIKGLGFRGTKPTRGVMRANEKPQVRWYHGLLPRTVPAHPGRRTG